MAIKIFVGDENRGEVVDYLLRHTANYFCTTKRVHFRQENRTCILVSVDPDEAIKELCYHARREWTNKVLFDHVKKYMPEAHLKEVKYVEVPKRAEYYRENKDKLFELITQRLEDHDYIVKTPLNDILPSFFLREDYKKNADSLEEKQGVIKTAIQRCQIAYTDLVSDALLGLVKRPVEAIKVLRDRDFLQEVLDEKEI